MNRPWRIPSLLLGAASIAVLAVSFTSAAQEIDNRPVYYVMLKSLEDGFEAYNIALAADLKMWDSNLNRQYQSDRLVIAKELESLQKDRTRREAAFNSERETLNERIAVVTAEMALREGRISEERRIQKLHAPRYANDPRVKTLKERIATLLAEIDAVRASYLTQLTATQKARTALTRQIDEYMGAGDPLALEIRSLDQDWQRFAEKERRKLKRLADDYAVEYTAFEEWLERERAVLESEGAAVANTLKRDREQRAIHGETETALRALIDEYNELVEVHDKASSDDRHRDQRALKFADLEERIAELRTTLAQARDAVLKVNEQIERENQEFSRHYERFAAKKRERGATLAVDLAELNATGLTVEAAIDARRRKVDAQIKTLEVHISGELRDARVSLETSNARLIESFGKNHEGFDTAITRVLDANDDGLLYTASGAPRFDLSRPMTGILYTTVEQLDADRHQVDMRIVAIEKSEGGAQQSSAGHSATAGTLDRDRAALSTGRQQLLESYATFVRQYQARLAVLERNQRAIEARFAEERRLLGELFSARASLTRAEMQALQEVLVAAVKGFPGPDSGNDDHAKMVNALQEKAGQMSAPVDEELLAPHALMDHMASELPGGVAGSRPDGWRSSTSRNVVASRELTGADKAALAAAWLARVRRQPRFVEIANELGASGAVLDGGQALSNLFMAGVSGHTTITEQRMDDGGIRIRIRILGRDYQLDANTYLERLPGG
jgi:chromosome segregation ATPase